MLGVEIVFIHGFGGDPRDWDPVISRLGDFTLRTLDLKSIPVDEMTDWESFTSAVAKEIDLSRPVILCGYSFGGRLALHLARHGRIRGLILVSAGFGEEEPARRAERKKQDLAWAKLLSADPEAFWARWYDQELFATMGAVDAALRGDWMACRFLWNNKVLAKYLECLGPADQDWLLPTLSEENSPPILYIVGEKDKKYVALSQRIMQECQTARVTVLKNAGHAIPLEAPAECAGAIKRFLDEMK